jgi:hypothetical protein
MRSSNCSTGCLCSPQSCERSRDFRRDRPSPRWVRQVGSIYAAVRWISRVPPADFVPGTPGSLCPPSGSSDPP